MTNKEAQEKLCKYSQKIDNFIERYNSIVAKLKFLTLDDYTLFKFYDALGEFSDSFNLIHAQISQKKSQLNRLVTKSPNNPTEINLLGLKKAIIGLENAIEEIENSIEELQLNLKNDD